MIGGINNLGLLLFPDPASHFGTHGGHFGFIRWWDVPGSVVLPLVLHCRRWAYAPGAVRLILLLYHHCLGSFVGYIFMVILEEMHIIEISPFINKFLYFFVVDSIQFSMLENKSVWWGRVFWFLKMLRLALYSYHTFSYHLYY